MVSWQTSLVVFAFAFGACFVDPADAQIRGERIANQIATPAAAIFEETLSLYEGIVDLRLRGRDEAIGPQVGYLVHALKQLRSYLDQQTYAVLDKHRTEMERDSEAGKMTSVATAAAESFKRLATFTKPQIRPLPLEVAIYRYQAYRLALLATEDEVSWHEISLSAAASDAALKPLLRLVRDENVRFMLSETQSGLRDAVETSSAARVTFAARIQIASSFVLADKIQPERALAKSR